MLADLKFTITRPPAHGTLKHGTTTLADGDTFSGSPQDVSYTPGRQLQRLRQLQVQGQRPRRPRRLHAGRHVLRRQARLDRADRPDHDRLGQRRPRRHGQHRHHQRGHRLHADRVDFGFSDVNDWPGERAGGSQDHTLATARHAEAQRRRGHGRPVRQRRRHRRRQAEVRAGRQRQRHAVRELHLPGPGQRRHRQRRRRPRPERQHDHRQRHARSTTPRPALTTRSPPTRTAAYTFDGGRLRLQRSQRPPGQRAGRGQDHDAGDRTAR